MASLLVDGMIMVWPLDLRASSSFVSGIKSGEKEFTASSAKFDDCVASSMFGSESVVIKLDSSSAWTSALNKNNV